MNREQPPSRLRWRCRRGMQELDAMLGRWLESAWPLADASRRRAFTTLLEHEDDRLWHWLTGREEPPAGLRDVVSEVRGYTFGDTRR